MRAGRSDGRARDDRIRPLTDLAASEHQGSPAWSPDGASIAFSAYTFERNELRLVTADGSDLPRTILTDDRRAFVRDLSWSPDGERLAFIQDIADSGVPPQHRIDVVDVDGTNRRTVATVADAHDLDWHPDGTRLLVSTFDGATGEVMVVDLDDGLRQTLASGATFAKWTADGDRVVYFTTEEADPWRLAEGRIESGTLERTRFLGDDDVYLYGYFDLAVGSRVSCS